MKTAKAIGILFIVVGLLFAVLGIIEHVKAVAEKEDYIYTTARIVRIDERETGDSDFPVEHTTYVEIEVDGEKITVPLNTYNSSFKTGKQIDIYYLENDMQMAYEKGSEHFYLLFAFVGTAFAILGAIFVFRKRNMQTDCELQFSI